jgi:hypothetical protein
MVQFWAVSWVEPVFRDFFRENGTFFREAKCGDKWRFVVGVKWRKMALSKRNLSEKNWRKMALLKRRAGFPQKELSAAQRLGTVRRETPLLNPPITWLCLLVL